MYGGDGEYYGTVASELISNGPQFFLSDLYAGYKDIFAVVKVASIGVVPSYLIPQYFFENPSAQIYYISQASFHVFLCVLVSSIAIALGDIKKNSLFAIVLFAVISPTFFELGVAPTRHYVTFSGLFLLFVSHVALQNKLTIHRVILWLLALTVIFVSKAPYLIVYFFYYLLIKIISLHKKNRGADILHIFALAFLFVAVVQLFFIEKITFYTNFISMGMNVFSSSVVSLPIIGWLVKYVYALLSPFPWSKSSHFIETIYSGNELMFYMHVISSITGLYFFSIFFLKWRLIWSDVNTLKSPVPFGLIMSASIIGGATGFHGYLSIFFPFFAPLLLSPEFRVPIIYSLIFVVMAEFFVQVSI